MDRTAVFIDGAYFDKLLELEFNRARVDFGKFVDAIGSNDNVFRTYYYHCPPYVNATAPTRDEQRRAEAKSRFFSALSSLPRFQVKLGKLVFRGHDNKGNPIFIQKLVDIMLGVDLVSLAATRQITKAILVAGDSDFVPAIEAAKRQGVLISLWHGSTQDGQFSYHSSVHRELWEICDERFLITDSLIKNIKRQTDNKYTIQRG